MSSEIRIIIIVGSLLFVSILIIVCFLIFFFQKRHNFHILEKQQLQSQFQQTLLQAQLEIQEQTLKNISEEIHDNIGQVLSLAKLNLNTMPPVADETIQQKITNSTQLVSKAIVDLRSLSRSLDTDFIQQSGLLEAVQYELDMIKKTGAHHTELETHGAVYRFDKQKELILFRIVQETFNNIIKHAGAKNIKLGITYSPQSIELKITDDGKGVDLSPLNEDNHKGFGLGIRNMHNRAKLIGADFNMHSTLGKGTEVSIHLPKGETNHAAE